MEMLVRVGGVGAEGLTVTLTKGVGKEHAPVALLQARPVTSTNPEMVGVKV